MNSFSSTQMLPGLALVALLLTACGGDGPVEEKVLRPVRYQIANMGGSGNVRTFSGTAQNSKSINLSFRTNGILVALNMKSGQEVKKGDLLARLDNVQAKLAYEQASASLNSATSQMNTAKSNLDRTRSLYEKGSASLSDFENAKNNFNSAEANFESAKRSVAIQQDQMSYGSLYAPESGVLTGVSVEIDENIAAGQAIAVLNAGSSMEIALGLPENVITKTKVGMQGEIRFSTLGDAVFSGVVSEVSPAVDAATASYPVKVRITDASDAIRAGMSANVTLILDEEQSVAEDVLVVPAKSVGEDGEGRFIFIIDGEGATGVVRKQHVTIGRLTEDGFEILEGLEAGQKVATAGLQTLLEGQEVRLD